nr:MAG TPA: hypothetical protein [Caudoviricetes sp.]
MIFYTFLYIIKKYDFKELRAFWLTFWLTQSQKAYIITFFIYDIIIYR